MSTEMSGEPASRGAPPIEDGQCCARLYESDLAVRLLGDSFHPGGVALTDRLAGLMNVTRDSHVVDAASGRGTSACYLAQRFGCRVTGFDLSRRNVERATEEAGRLGLEEQVRFECADAEHLPIPDESVDAVICECAFCTFPDKPRAAHEFARVVRRGGCVGLSDITREPGRPGELNDLMAWIACLADARSSDVYAAWLTEAGLRVSVIEAHDDVLKEMVRAIGVRLFATEILAGLNALELPGVDLDAAKRLARQALDAVENRRLGYAVVCAIKPQEAQP